MTGDEDLPDGIHTGHWLMGQTFPELSWHVENLIPEGFTLNVGGPKLGKSWLMHNIALAASCGGEVLSERLAARPVLHLALEDSNRRLKSRTTKLGYGARRLTNWSYLTRLPPGRRASEVIADWLDRLECVDPAPLVIIDTLGKVRGSRLRDESPYDHDYRVGAAIKSLADSIDGMGIVAVHHDRKAQSPDFVDDVSGTNGLAGSADTIVVLRRDRNQPDGVLLVSGRDVTEAAYAVTFDAGAWSLHGDSWHEAAAAASEVAARTGRGELAGRIVAWLAANAAGTPAEVAAKLNENASAVKQSLFRMFDAGVVDRDKGSYFLPPPTLGATP